MHWLKPFLPLTLVGLFIGPAQNELVPADYMLQHFVQRAHREALIGTEAPVTDELFTKIRETIKKSPVICSKLHSKAVSAFAALSAAKEWDAVAADFAIAR